MSSPLAMDYVREQPVWHMTPADPQQHTLAIAQITADAFAGGQHVDEISRQYIGNCHYDWQTTRLIWDGDRLIHHWGVWGYPMRIGSVQLQVAGVGAVVTAEPYRQRGLMHRAARASFLAMAEQGYDVSLLRGRHYAQFGYVRAWNYVTYRLKAPEVPTLELVQPYELLGPEHMDGINAMYNREYAPYGGTAVRPTYRMLCAEDLNAYGWFDEIGQLIGYVRAVPTDDQQTLQCLEATGDPQQCLAVLAALFRAGQYETLTFFTLPQQHAVLKFIRRGACVVEDQYFFHSGWQVRLVNLQRALLKLRPVLEARVQHSPLTDWRGDLYLAAGEQTATLHLEAGRVTILPGEPGQHGILGGADVARFLIGSDEPAEIRQQAAMVCTGRAAELTDVLFPNLHPVLSQWDEY